MFSDRRASFWMNAVVGSVVLVSVVGIGLLTFLRNRVEKNVSLPEYGDYFRLYLRSAVEAERRGDVGSWRSNLEKAQGLRPTSATANITLGRYWLIQGDRSRAWPLYQKAVEEAVLKGTLPYGGADTLAWYGDLAASLPKPSEFEKAYRMAVYLRGDGNDSSVPSILTVPSPAVASSILPKSPPLTGTALIARAHENAARSLLFEFGHGVWKPSPEASKDAIRHCRRALSITPKSSAVGVLLSIALLASGRKEEALSQIAKVRKATPLRNRAFVIASEKELTKWSNGEFSPLPRLPEGQSRTLALPRR